jgi:hypothetical protein
MARSYAVSWRRKRDLVRIGKLESGAAGFQLTGVDATGRSVTIAIPREHIQSIGGTRDGARLRGSRAASLVLTTGERLSIASLDGPGTGIELVEELASAVPAGSDGRSYARLREVVHR